VSLLQWVMLNTVQATMDGMIMHADKGFVHATARDSRDFAKLDEMLELEDNYADALVAQPVAEIVQKHAHVFRKKRAQVAMRAESQHLFQMVGRMSERFGRDFQHQTSVLDEECERELEKEEEEEEEQERQVAATNPRQHTAWSYSALLQASSAAELSILLSSQSLPASYTFDAQKIASFLRAHVRTHVDKRGRDRLAHISWPEHVLCTQNFMKTVAWENESTNAASPDFALNEYLRLAEVRAPADAPAPKHCCPNIVNLLLDLLQCHVASQACAVLYACGTYCVEIMHTSDSD
jgi:hypothetical protein